MKHLFFLLLTASFVASCSDWVPEPDKELREEAEKMQALQKTGCVFSSPDHTLSGIELRNAASTEQVLGKDTKLTGDSTHLFYSGNRKQMLALTVFAGDYLNQVSVFRVYYAPNGNQPYPKMKTSDFVTEKGIRLGISRKELTGKLGSCYIVKDSTANTVTLKYLIVQDLVYFATYQFRNDQLEAMAFGYEYP
ncbi:hypothetical protein [Fluviicola taffensis]|uniref:hypothetical protein n=1 Tax=Fluviicola taffensis TaxID=191579 RepID=UPI003137A9F9